MSPAAAGRPVALFGGSFDPPHLGHLLAATYVLATRPHELWFLPSAQHPFHKALRPFELRRQMCELLAEDLGPRASVCTLEQDLGGEGRTVDTLRALLAQQPELDLRLVLGADILLERHAWKSWDEVCRLAPPIFLGRGGYRAPAGFDLEIELPEVSSTEVRERLASGAELRHLVPRRVLEFIRAQGLYGADRAS